MLDTPQLIILKEFFNGIWNTNAIDQQAIEEIRRLAPCRILDVGCGNNLYKQFFSDLFGIDIVNQRADQVCDILEFEPEDKFEVILCFGSLNFGGRKDILVRLKKVREILTDQGVIFMKVNPGIRWSSQPDLIIYPWNFEDIYLLANEAGLMVQGRIQQKDTPSGLRYTFKYCMNHE